MKMDDMRQVRQRGQALAEMAFVVVLLVMLSLGIIDFGRMLMVQNVITHAVRDGARIAALTKDTDWGGFTMSGAPLTTVRNRIRDQLSTVMSTSDATTIANTAVVTRTNTGLPTGETASVNVTGSVPFIFSFPGVWGGTVAVNRTATYRFEG
jgi:Flp pilus assembly protein TadG